MRWMNGCTKDCILAMDDNLWTCLSRALANDYSILHDFDGLIVDWRVHEDAGID